MSLSVRLGRTLAALSVALAAGALAAPGVLAHEERDVSGYTLEVGFIDEPVFVGERSGLDLFVHKGDQAVSGLEKTLKAQGIYGSTQIDLALSPDDADPSHYTSVFIPTASGPYTFHLFGTIDGTQVDQRFTSSPTGFDEVRDVAAGEFPDQLPSIVDVAAQAKQGADAAALVPVALAVGGLGALLGLAALGVALAGRRRSTA
jgi:hypothetical protein